MSSYVDYADFCSTSTDSSAEPVKQTESKESKLSTKIKSMPAKLIKFRASFSVFSNSKKEDGFRSRCKTWPFTLKSNNDSTKEYEKYLIKSLYNELGIHSNKQMKNPWGNLSYSQLIERAIESSPWKCLSLKEIYAWFTKYVPYFEDKMHFKSTIGWKNSIRHNLSLHKRFVRIGIYHTINHRRVSSKPIKYVWTSLKYKPKGLKEPHHLMDQPIDYQGSSFQAVTNQYVIDQMIMQGRFHLNSNQLLHLNALLSRTNCLTNKAHQSSSNDSFNIMKCSCSSCTFIDNYFKVLQQQQQQQLNFTNFSNFTNPLMYLQNAVLLNQARSAIDTPTTTTPLNNLAFMQNFQQAQNELMTYFLNSNAMQTTSNETPRCSNKANGLSSVSLSRPTLISNDSKKRRNGYMSSIPPPFNLDDAEDQDKQDEDDDNESNHSSPESIYSTKFLVSNESSNESTEYLNKTTSSSSSSSCLVADEDTSTSKQNDASYNFKRKLIHRFKEEDEDYVVVKKHRHNPNSVDKTTSESSSTLLNENKKDFNLNDLFNYTSNTINNQNDFNILKNILHKPV